MRIKQLKANPIKESNFQKICEQKVIVGTYENH